MLASCDYDSFEEESALGGIQTANPFVRLLTGNAGGTVDVEVSEGSTTTDVAIESQLTTGGNTSVNYTLGGTAEYGTIYTIEGATASGGTLSIPFQEDPDNNAPAQADVTINFLVDTLVVNPQTIELTLASASSDDGSTLDVGQGSLRRTLVITLVND